MDKKIKYLIVEDEEKSRETLLKKIQLCNLNDIMCIGMAANASEALMLAKLTPPDFVFLDINLPGKNGFQLLEELNSLNIFPLVIFTSAHTESHILLDALKKSPITYLLKPIDLDELEQAILKVCNTIDESKPKFQPINKIKLNAYNGTMLFFPDQIMMIKSELHQSMLYVDDGKIIKLNQNIGSFDEDHPLVELPFFKVDRSTIINLNKVEQLLPKRGECSLRSGNNVLIAKISQSGFKKIANLLEDNQGNRN